MVRSPGPAGAGTVTPAESTALLRAHDVPEERHEYACWACGGNPLALRVAARLIGADPHGVTDEDLPRELALSIFRQLIGDIPSGAHRQALEACAHAATIDESLLRAVVTAPDAGVLFGWLRGAALRHLGPARAVSESRGPLPARPQARRAEGQAVGCPARAAAAVRDRARSSSSRRRAGSPGAGARRD